MSDLGDKGVSTACYSGPDAVNAMSMSDLTAPLWDEVAARCPAAADRAALALCCRAGAAAARRALHYAGVTPPELPALAAAATAGRLPALDCLCVGAERRYNGLRQLMSLEAVGSLSALTGLTKLYALTTAPEGTAAVRQLIASLGALPRLSAALLTLDCVSGAAHALAGLTQLRHLELWCDNEALHDADAAMLAALTGLTALAVPHHELTSAGLGPLLAGMACLEELDLSYNHRIRLADPPAADALVALPRLRSLAAVHDEFLDDGLEACLLVPLTGLELATLGVGWCPRNAVAALARLPALRGAQVDELIVRAGTLDPLAGAAAGRLRALDVGPVVNRAGFPALMHFTGLTRLRMRAKEDGLFSNDDSDGINPWEPSQAETAALVRALTGLVDLALPDCAVGAPGAAVLAASLPRLTRLDVNRNPLGDAGAAALAGGRLHGLLELRAPIADIGDEGAAAIAGGLTSLTRLDLRANPISAVGAAALAGMRALRFLNLPGSRSETVGESFSPSVLAGVVDPELRRRLQALDKAHMALGL